MMNLLNYADIERMIRMKYLLIKKNKLPQIHETNNIPNVITKMFGRKFRILNENDIAYCRSQSVYATKLD